MAEIIETPLTYSELNPYIDRISDNLVGYKFVKLIKILDDWIWVDSQDNPIIDQANNIFVWGTIPRIIEHSEEFTYETARHIIDIAGRKEQRLRLLTDSVNILDEANLIINKWAWSFFIGQQNSIKTFVPDGTESFILAKDYPQDDLGITLQLDRMTRFCWDVNRHETNFNVALSTDYINRYSNVLLSSNFHFDYFNWLAWPVQEFVKIPIIMFYHIPEYGILDVPSIPNLRAATRVTTIVWVNQQVKVLQNYFYI